MDDDRASEGDSDFTIRGRLISLVEKVAYLRRKMTDLPKKKQAKKPSKPFLPSCLPVGEAGSREQHRRIH